MKTASWWIVLLLALICQNAEAQKKWPVLWGKRGAGFVVGMWSGAYKMRQTYATADDQHCLILAPQAGIYVRNVFNLTVSTELLMPLRRAYPQQHAFGWNYSIALRTNLMRSWFSERASLAMYWIQEYMVANYYSNTLYYGSVIRVRTGNMVRAQHFRAYSPLGFGIHTGFGQGLGLFVEWSMYGVYRNGAFPFKSNWRIGINYGF